MRINQSEDIEAWQLARELTRKICALNLEPMNGQLFVLMNYCHPPENIRGESLWENSYTFN